MLSVLNKKHSLIFVFICVLFFIAYGRSFFGEFIWDDSLNILHNDFVHEPSNVKYLFSKEYLTSPDEVDAVGQKFVGAGEMSYRPVTTFSYLIDAMLWGRKAFGYHLTNAFLHLFCAFQVFLLSRYFFRETFFSLFVFSLFLLHPIQAEAVMVISMRDDVLAGFFYFLALNGYEKSFKGESLRHFILTAGAFALALFSKESAVSFPFAVMLMDIYQKRIQNFDDLKKKPLWLRYVFILLVLGLFFVVNFLVFKREVSGWNPIVYYSDIWHWLAGNLEIAGLYTLWFLNPSAIFSTIPDPSYYQLMGVSQYPFWMLLALIGGLILFSIISKKNCMIFWVMVWIFVCLLPVSNIVPIANIFAPRYLYIPMAGMSLVAAVVIKNMHWLKNKYFLKYALCSVFILFLVFQTHLMSFRFQNELTFRTHLKYFHPGSLFVDYGLGLAYLRSGQVERALVLFEDLNRLFPNSVPVMSSLSFIYQELKFYEKAVLINQRLIKLEPEDHFWLKEQQRLEKLLKESI